jgi:hypothetical protein
MLRATSKPEAIATSYRKRLTTSLRSPDQQDNAFPCEAFADHPAKAFF